MTTLDMVEEFVISNSKKILFFLPRIDVKRVEIEHHICLLLYLKT
jgi:hypothetical protein